MRRLLSTLLLALLVVCAQQAALVHEIGHGLPHGSGAVTSVAGTAVATSAAEPRAPESGTTEGGSYCDKCFQFAHVSGAGFSSHPVAALLVAGTESARASPAADLAAEAPQSRSRGPPIVL